MTSRGQRLTNLEEYLDWSVIDTLRDLDFRDLRAGPSAGEFDNIRLVQPGMVQPASAAGERPPPRPLQPRRPQFLLLPIAAVLLPLMMMGVGGWISWRSTWSDSEAQLERKASAGAEYASRVLAGYVVALGRINDFLQGLSDADIRAREPELHATLLQPGRRIAAGIPSYVFDRQGNALVGATVFPVPRDLSVADRDFFTCPGGGTPPALHVGRVYEGRLDHNLYFAISGAGSAVRTACPAGGFDGVVNVTVSPALVAAGMKRFLDDDNDMLTLGPPRRSGPGPQFRPGRTSCRRSAPALHSSALRPPRWDRHLQGSFYRRQCVAACGDAAGRGVSDVRGGRPLARCHHRRMAGPDVRRIWCSAFPPRWHCWR